MTKADYEALPEEKKAEVRTTRECYECGAFLVRTKHSAGNLHAICPECWRCPDCDDGE